MKGAFLLDVIIAQGAPVFELLACEDQTLLVGGNTLLILDLLLDVVNSIRRLDFESDSLAGEGFNKNLHSAKNRVGEKKKSEG